MQSEVHSFASLEHLCRAAADQIVRLAQAAVEARGRFVWALSGGRTPSSLYRSLTQNPWRGAFPWAQTQFFWSDERWVKPDDPQSNYALAHKTLLEHVSVPALQVHPMPTFAATLADGAREYEDGLHAFFAGREPVFDLILLGVGPDGHTASIFPGNEPAPPEAWVAATEAPPGSPVTQRLTLTLSLINRARTVIFLIAGEEKKTRVRELLEAPELARSYPAGNVRPQERLIWFLDHAAARDLRDRGRVHPAGE
ncbi:MAG: 6-phosphogluconolactonase [Candidatus Firestonebacteria bacterium]|nr:6-phosphogluconolactonase [Candidatus Firestonebacteria bacterium]